jgi:3-(3-hydroxy-phenyl)propionate hydroxylase
MNAIPSAFRTPRMSEPGQVDVAIVGLGPTGLVLAHMLGIRGHKVVVLEKEPVFYGNARAVYTDDECMRIFQSIGVAEELQAKMIVETPVQFVRPDGKVMAQYRPMKRPFGWPVVNFFYQPYLETTLSETLSRYPNVEVWRGRELVDFSQDGQGVKLVHQATQEARFTEHGDARQATGSGDLDVRTLQAKYMVGCDGGRSIVRTRLGIDMTGKNFPEPWLVVDLERKPGQDGLRHLPYFNFVVDPKLPVVSCTQPDRFHRFEFMLMPGETKENMEKPETVRHYLSKYINPDQFEVKRRLVYTFNALMANAWRRDRILLAGDAAHMTPQFMGQGASSGIRDAYNLGWKLDLVLRGISGERILDSYEQERRGHAQSMIDVSVLLKDVVSMTNPLGTLLRDGVIKLMQLIPPLRRWTQEGGFKPMPICKRGSYLGLPRKGLRGPEGALAPQPEIRRFDGHRQLLDDLLGQGFSLVGLGLDPSAHLDATSRQTLDTLGTRMVTLYPYCGRPQGLNGIERNVRSGVVEVEDIHDLMVAWFRKAGLAEQGVAVLRPDRFAFAVVSPAELNKAVSELARQMALGKQGKGTVVPLTQKAA